MTLTRHSGPELLTIWSTIDWSARKSVDNIESKCTSSFYQTTFRRICLNGLICTPPKTSYERWLSLVWPASIQKTQGPCLIWEGRFTLRPVDKEQLNEGLWHANFHLTNYRQSFVSKFFRTFCEFVNFKYEMETGYHPHWNGQPDQCNKTLVAWMHQDTNIYHSSWNELVQLFTFVYSRQIHQSTAMAKVRLPYFQVGNCQVKPYETSWQPCSTMHLNLYGQTLTTTHLTWIVPKEITRTRWSKQNKRHPNNFW